MPRPGDNLPDFRATQIDFAAHIRNPEIHPRPADVEPRRMQIYLELFYNNIENFLATAFPVAKRVLGDAVWHEIAREFVHRHPSESPYFLEISQEYLSFLGNRQDLPVPEFYLELCHYEWVELYLSVSEEEIPEDGIDPDGDLWAEEVALSPLHWSLSYRFPVHRIGAGYQPEVAPEELSFLVVYRKRDDRVHFMESNQLTHLLLEQLAVPHSGRVAIQRLSERIPEVDSHDLEAQGRLILERLRESEILLGTRTS